MNMRMLRHRRRGSAAIEYAVFLALIAAGLVLAADTVGYAMRGSFDESALAVHAPIAPRHLPVEDMMAPDSDLLASLVAPSSNEGVQMYQIATVAGSMFCGALVWYGLYCRRTGRIKNVSQLVDDDEQLSELTHDELFAKRQQILRILSTDLHALVDSRLEARHLMSRRLVTVSPKASPEEMRALMEEHKLRHLLVCNDAGQLIGIVSDRDLASRSGKMAQQLMTTDVMAIEPRALIKPAITLLINKRISCLPVIEDGVPVGVLTSTDLMMTLQCCMQLLHKVATEGIGTATKSDQPASALN